MRPLESRDGIRSFLKAKLCFIRLKEFVLNFINHYYIQYLTKHGLLYFCIVFLLFKQELISQTDNFYDAHRWIHFTTQSGLPSNNVFQIFERKDGTMWSSTPDGISWYNGFEWKPIYYQGERSDIIKGRIVGEIRDELLIHTVEGALLLGRTAFRKLAVEHFDEVALLDDDLILVRKQEQLWQLKNNHLSIYIHPDKSFPTRVLFLYPVRKGTALLDASTGLYHLKNDALAVMLQSSVVRFTPYSIQENSHGNGIVAIKSPHLFRGVWSWNSTKALRRETTEGNDAIVAIGLGENNERITVYKTGLVRRSLSGDWQTVYEEAKLRKTNSILINSNSDIWFATSNGIFVYRRSLTRWTYWKYPPPDFRNTTNEIVKTKDGNIWVATANGIDIHDTRGNVKTIEKIHGEQLYVVTGLAEDSSGNVWISSGSSFMGAFRWDGKVWKHFNPWDSTQQVWIHKIVVDAQKRIWFLGLGKYSPRHGTKQPGAYVYDGVKFTHVGEENGLLSGRVYSFAYSPDSSLWFGTYKGITRLKNGRWKHWTSEKLNVSRVFTIALGKNGNLWYGDNDFIANGLGCIFPDGTMKQFTIDDGLLDNNIWDIDVDSKENIWVSTQSGVSCFSNESFTNYDEHSGLKSSGGNWPILPLDDEVYVGTTGEGVAILDLKAEQAPPPIIRILEPLMDEDEVNIQWKTFAYGGEVEPEKIFTRYSFNGKQWTAWEPVHDYLVKNLTSGRYTVRVQARGLLGQYNPSGETVSFTIPPPLYLRPIFYYPFGSVLVMMSGLFVMLYRSRVRRRKELAQSEAKFRAVATTTASAIFVFQEQRFLFANHAAEAITGYTMKELEEKSFLGLLHPDNVVDITIFIQEWLTKTAVPRRFECKILTKNEEEKWLDVTASRMNFMNTPAIIISAFDITAQKNAEESLRQSEERYRIFTELAADYAYMDRVEEDGRLTVLWLTESASRLYGYTLQEFIAPDFYLRFVHPEHVEEGMQIMFRVLKGESVSHEMRCIAKDGRVLWIHNEMKPIWNDAHTRVEFVYGVARDITQRKMDEEQKRALTSELVQTEERERKRLAMYLHDIIGQHLAEGKLKLREILKSEVSPSLEKQLREISQNFDHAIKDTRALTFELSPPVLQDVRFDNAINILAEQLFSKHNITLRMQHDEKEKPLEPQMKVLLFYAVRELFFNIIKHANASEVQVGVFRTDDTLSIIIEDNGCGFDFENALKQKTSTTGFGLKNVSERIEQVGAKFEIISAPSRGTRVIISLPMKSMTP